MPSFARRLLLALILSAVATSALAVTRVVSDSERAVLAKGADEQDLVNSGLEETMISAYQEIVTVKDTHGTPDLRIAAFLDAINKVARSYMELGIFP